MSLKSVVQTIEAAQQERERVLAALERTRVEHTAAERALAEAKLADARAEAERIGEMVSAARGGTAVKTKPAKSGVDAAARRVADLSTQVDALSRAAAEMPQAIEQVAAEAKRRELARQLDELRKALAPVRSILAEMFVISGMRGEEGVNVAELDLLMWKLESAWGPRGSYGPNLYLAAEMAKARKSAGYR